MTATDAPPHVDGARRAGPPPGPRPGRPAGPRRRPAPAPVRTSRVVISRIDPWSVLKVSVLFYLSLCIVLLTAGVLLWAGAASIGVIGNFEGFMDSIGFTDFELQPAVMLRGAALGGMVLVVAGTFATVLMAALYNLIHDVVGGLRVTLAEDESARRGR
jgi:hypothetical protein